MTSANHRFTPSRKISYFQYSCTKLWIQFLDLGILSSYFERTNPYIMPYLIKVTLLKSLSRWFPSIYLISQCPIGLWDYNFYSWGDFPKVPATYFLQESAFHSHWITLSCLQEPSRKPLQYIALQVTTLSHCQIQSLCVHEISINSHLKTYKVCFCYFWHIICTPLGHRHLLPSRPPVGQTFASSKTSPCF